MANIDSKPIVLLTHVRSRSTAFLRVSYTKSVHLQGELADFSKMMMTRPDVLNCLHEPFAEPFYFGPERMAERYTNGLNENRRLASGHKKTNYYDVMEKIKMELDKVSYLTSLIP